MGKKIAEVKVGAYYAYKWKHPSGKSAWFDSRGLVVDEGLEELLEELASQGNAGSQSASSLAGEILEEVVRDTVVEWDAKRYLVVQMGHAVYDRMKAWLKEKQAI
jgi:hypothetical protein